MKILALEFSSGERSVALLTDGESRGAASESSRQSTRAFAMIESVLAQARLDRGEIDCLAVGLGPGSYNGIRASIALAQGWQLAAGEHLKLLGISSVECLAHEAVGRGWRGKVHVVINAQRDELYFSTYEINGDRVQEVMPLRLVKAAEAQAMVQPKEIVAGPEVTRWFGEGRSLFPTASMIGRLAVGRTTFVPAEALEPIYLRETRFVKAPPPRIIPSA